MSCLSASSSRPRRLVCGVGQRHLRPLDVRLALVRLARAESTWVWNSDGSSRAMTCPFRTIELKSAFELLNRAGHLAADLDRRHRLERAGRGNLADDRPRVTPPVTIAGAASPRRA